MTVIVARSLFGDKELPGDGGCRGDGPVDDGVATRIPLIGVPTEASKSVSESETSRKREVELNIYEDQTLELLKYRQ